MTFKYKDWYAKNKDKLALARKSRYTLDHEYRARRVQASAERRRVLKPPVPKTGLSVVEACDALGIGVWTLNRWKNQNYIPVTSLRGVQFTETQMQLLGLIKEFFTANPCRAAANNKDQLDSVIAVVLHNWKD